MEVLIWTPRYRLYWLRLMAGGKTMLVLFFRLSLFGQRRHNFQYGVGRGQ